MWPGCRFVPTVASQPAAATRRLWRSAADEKVVPRHAERGRNEMREVFGAHGRLFERLHHFRAQRRGDRRVQPARERRVVQRRRRALDDLHQRQPVLGDAVRERRVARHLARRPVLASDVQVGKPRSGEEDEVRFALTSEAGLNDGLAFPFVHLALAFGLAAASSGACQASQSSAAGSWSMSCGVSAPVSASDGSWDAAWAGSPSAGRARSCRTRDGLVAIGATLVAYASAEICHGYGFLAVFVAALGAARYREESRVSRSPARLLRTD